jgi:hypothetical protein
MAANPNYDSVVHGLSFDKKVNLFFGNASMRVATGLIHSTLALTLSDIKDCAPRGSNTLAFPRAMCLMVAIDLLAKMYRGHDAQNEGGPRFIEFTEFALRGIASETDIGEKIYAFRNALHHSYRLPTEWKPKGSTTKVSRRFRLIEEGSEPRLTWDTSDACIFINLYRLQEEVEDGIKRFHSLAAGFTDSDDQRKFQSMFDKYGWLYVGQ